jgi:putative SOS response-associated peptidase YedK
MLLHSLHDRMPALIAPDNWATWLGEIAATDPELKALLRPYPDRAMAFWPVDRKVGNVKNDSPDLFSPLCELPLTSGLMENPSDRSSDLG